MAASNYKHLDVQLLHLRFSRSLYPLRFKKLLILCVCLYFLCVFLLCCHLFAGSEGNKCTRFQWLILLLRTGEPNMWGQLWKEGDTGREGVCVRKRRGRREEGRPSNGWQIRGNKDCVCVFWRWWKVTETWKKLLTWWSKGKCNWWMKQMAYGQINCVFFLLVWSWNRFPHKWLCPTGFVRSFVEWPGCYNELWAKPELFTQSSKPFAQILLCPHVLDDSAYRFSPCYPQAEEFQFGKCVRKAYLYILQMDNM